MKYKFVEFHNLVPFAAASLNQDDNGDPKTIPIGTATRTRVSSQALKRWARTIPEEHPGSLRSILKGGKPLSRTFRSREILLKKVFDPMIETHGIDPETALLVVKGARDVIVGKPTGKTSETPSPVEASEMESTSDSKSTSDSNSTSKRGKSSKSRGVDLAKALEVPVAPWTDEEMNFILQVSLAQAAKIKENPSKKPSMEDFKKNLKGFLDMPGIEAKLFGRLVTGDIESRIDGALHVAHAWTVHAAQAELDFLTAVDDFSPQGSAFLGSRQLTSGILYLYSVVDTKMLSEHGEGDDVIQQILRWWTGVQAHPLPQTRKGSTAPFESSSFLMVCKTNQMPQTLGQAFFRPVPMEGEGDLMLRTYARLGRYVREDLPLLDLFGRTSPEFRFLAKGERAEVLRALGEPFTADRFLGLADLSRWASED